MTVTLEFIDLYPEGKLAILGFEKFCMKEKLQLSEWKSAITCLSLYT